MSWDGMFVSALFDDNSDAFDRGWISNFRFYCLG